MNLHDLLLSFSRILVFIQFVSSEVFQIHNHMNENELQFYFNTKSKHKVSVDYDIIEFRSIAKRELDNDKHKSFSINVFQRPINLRLKPNKTLFSPDLKVWKLDSNGTRSDIFVNEKLDGSNFLIHRDNSSTFALWRVEDGKFSGIGLLPDGDFDIQPLNERLHHILNKHSDDSTKYRLPHIIKRAIFSPDELNVFNNQRGRRQKTFNVQTNKTSEIRTGSTKYNSKLIIELGVFFDAAAYSIFAPFFNFNDRKLSEMLLAYINGVQAIYHQPSLRTTIDITIVHMEIMRKQPQSLQTFNGERDGLLDSFCEYQKRINPPDDYDARHWDMALYLSGLDFYAYENGVNSRVTMGLSTVRGVCSPRYACVIAEFGTTNSFGRPYPSAGFNSVYISAHEMGHNLGMYHDSSGNPCSKDGFIMSPSRGTQGETVWSYCSAEVARGLYSWADCLKDTPHPVPNEYDAWKFSGYPGQIWSAKKQCELLLIDKDAMDTPTNGLPRICENLQCRSPHRSGYFFSGPALEGTDCGETYWCEAGSCVRKRKLQQPSIVINGGWSAWLNEKCQSQCLKDSTGFQVRRRTCDNPKPLNTNKGCAGQSYDVILCRDIEICRGHGRKSIDSYASKKCSEFSSQVPEIDRKGVGKQAPHEESRLWMGCAIFCRRIKDGTYYTPRLELNNLAIDPYFPDGTLCHSTKNQKFYCLQHHCLPEGFQFNKNIFWAFSEDIPISGNANPNPSHPLNSKLVDYLSLDRSGKPLLTHIKAEDIIEYQLNEKWVDDNDYKIVQNL